MGGRRRRASELRRSWRPCELGVGVHDVCDLTVITRYDTAETDVIGIGHLSDRLVGRPPIRAGFLPDAAGMSIADRQELQRRLTAAGFDTEGADGVIGGRTRDAIAGYQARAGLAVTGEPSLELLAGLR